AALDADSQRRLRSNPLRILDTKNPAMQALVECAPKLIDFLGEASLAHFAAVRAVLDAAGLEYRVNTRLVRGMDYYNLTVFEWVTDQLGSQGTVCGGGGLDGPFGQPRGKPTPPGGRGRGGRGALPGGGGGAALCGRGGGKPTPAVGWGMGVERMLLLAEAVGAAPGVAA